MRSKALLLGISTLVSTVALAIPPSTPVLDGRMGDYDDTDQRVGYTGGGGSFGAGNYLGDIYVTWDTNYLYVALSGGEVDNKLALMLDVDPGSGTGASTTTNWLSGPTYITYNDVGWQAALATDFGLDYMVASEGFYNNIVRVIYDGVDTPDSNTVISLFDSDNGASALGTPVDMAVQSDATSCLLKGFEARIPWSEIYAANTGRFGTVNSGEIVPQGASIRLFANLHNNTPSAPYSSNDAIPQQTGGAYLAGLLTSDTYLDVTIDGDLDGLPDVAVGDVHAPWIRYASGVASNRQVFVQFSEPVQESAVLDTNNWTVGGAQPGAVTMLSTNTLVLDLTNDLPAAGSLALVTATNIADDSGNQRLVSYCLSPASSGLTNLLIVRFVLESNSGLGISPGASNYFINGSSFPLEFGYPPATSSPLAVLSGTLRYRDVAFPPGTPATLNYKYSGQLNNTGTNNYEAVRLKDYATQSRKLTLPADVASLVITDHLGAAAGPWRDPATNTGYNALYVDARRGDAGVRQRTTITFQLDLSARNPAVLDRVMVLGSDPLRGFNYSASAISDYAAPPTISWQEAGITLYDDGLNGDTTAGDGIYARTWAFSTDGVDAEIVPDYPNYLVSGSYDTVPYFGDTWVERRNPRSFAYKFFVLKKDGSVVNTSSGDIEYYIEDVATTNITLPTYVWDNEDIPLPPPTNSPTMDVPVILSGGQVRVLFENLTNELQHGLLISTNLVAGWMDFGQRAVGSAGNWTALVSNANAAGEFYAAFAGPAQSYRGVYLEGLPVPSTGGTLRIWYNQHSRGLAGDRAVQIAGTFSGWAPVPMTFGGNGSWYYDATITAGAATNIEFKPRNVSGSIWENLWGGDNYITYKEYSRVTWTPVYPTNGEIFTITYEATTGPLVGATSVNAWVGYEEQFFAGANYPMTNTVGSTWVTAFPVSTNYQLSVNMYFNGKTNGSPAEIWDNENTGRRNRAFISPRPYGVVP